MTFTPDGTMWLATIFGQLYRYKDGKIETDEYGSNEYSDGVISLSTDSLGRLVIVSEHYVRLTAIPCVSKAQKKKAFIV